MRPEVPGNKLMLEEAVGHIDEEEEADRPGGADTAQQKVVEATKKPGGSVQKAIQ